MAFFEIEDMSGRVKAKVRQDRLELYGPLLSRGEAVFVTGKVSFPITDEPDEDAEPTILVDEVVPPSTRYGSDAIGADSPRRWQYPRGALPEASPPCSRIPRERARSSSCSRFQKAPGRFLRWKGPGSIRATPCRRPERRLFGDSVAELR